jgi:hypothetical protein
MGETGILVTFLDILALYYLCKTAVGFLKSKRKAAAVSFVLLFALCLGYIYFSVNLSLIKYYSEIVFLMLWMMLCYILNIIFVNGNHKVIVILITIFSVFYLFNLCLTTERWLRFLFILPICAEVLSMDCSSMKGYTTLNVANALATIIATCTLGGWLTVLMAAVYFVGSIFAYLKVNKLSALKNRKKVVKGDNEREVSKTL